jgi:hypothetical protein
MGGRTKGSPKPPPFNYKIGGRTKGSPKPPPFNYKIGGRTKGLSIRRMLEPDCLYPSFIIVVLMYEIASLSLL